MMGIGLILLAAISFLLVLSFLVFFHELGHYSVARFFGIAVERFSIGFGKPIYRRRSKAGVDWTISRIPLGGYVKFAGDQGAASTPDVEKLAEIREAHKDDPDAVPLEDIFHFRPVWQRMLVVLAGPLANFLLAIIVFAGLGATFGAQSYTWVVGEVIEGMPAEAAGVRIGDTILALDGRAVENTNDIVGYISLRSNTPIIMTVENDGEVRDVEVTPIRKEIRDGVGGLTEVGQIGMASGEGSSVSWKDVSLVQAIPYGVSQLGDHLGATLGYIKRIFTGKENGKQLGSVVKIATVTGKVAADSVQIDASPSIRLKTYLYSMFNLMALISIALGVANLMPLPVLDGGHLLYYGYEALAGRPLSQKKQEFGFRIGFAVLLALFVMLTINDIGYLRSIDFS